MRVRKLHVAAYGHLTDRQFDDLPPGLVIVLGDNEAGKSTLFSLLSTLLYGFYPLKDFAYKPWHADVYPEFRAELALDGGGSAEITRKLMSTPRATLSWNDSVRDLGNGDLPFIGHVGKELYDAIYALTQANLRSLDDAQRDEIEDRLLSGLSAELLRPTRDAIGELEDLAGALWRPNRRGDQRYRDLQQARQDARNQREAARQADEAVRDKAARLDEVCRRVDELVDEKAGLSVDIRRSDELLPIRARRVQIEKWRGQIKKPEAVDRLPEGLRAVHERLTQSVANAGKNVENLTADKEQLARQQAVFTSEDEQVLAHADEIDRWVRQITAHEWERSSLAELARNESRLTAAIQETSGAVFRQPWNEIHFNAVESVVLPDLKACILAFGEKRSDVVTRAAEARTVADVHVGGALPGWASLAAASVGVALLVLGLAYFSEVLLGVAAFLLLAAAFNFYLGRQHGLLERREAADKEQRAGHQRAAEEECAAARQAVVEALAALPVAEALLKNPDLTLCQSVEKLHAVCAEFRQLRSQHEEQEKQWQAHQDELAKLMTELEHESATPETLGLVERRLANARVHERARSEATTRVEQVEAALPGQEQKLDEAEQELSQFLVRLNEAVGEGLPPEELMSAATELQRLAGRVRDAQEELEGQHPDLANLVIEIEQLEAASEDPWSFDAVEVERRRDRLQEVQRELEERREEKGRLKTEIELARGQVSVGELDGEIARIEEEMDDVARHRDRLMLLACLLREADRRFREEHQPDVLKRSSDYLRTITGGRYKTLTTMTGEDGTDRLVVISQSGEPYPVESPLSGGTLDQIFLSFRLAVIDHLDEGHEMLPLLLDEALINWDDSRLERSGDILKQVAERRQVFLFTCHPWLARRLVDVTGAPVCELSTE